MSIKGASSGPFVVIGSNFAPGTTAADIQSALEPVCGSVMNCWIISQYPAVTAEITFAEKWSAENTVANFHNQKVLRTHQSYAKHWANRELQRPMVGFFRCAGNQLERRQITTLKHLSTTSVNRPTDNAVIATRTPRYRMENMDFRTMDSTATR